MGNPKSRNGADESGPDGSGVVRAGKERTRGDGALDATAAQGTTDDVQGPRTDTGKGSVRSGSNRTVGQGALDETRAGGVRLDQTEPMAPGKPPTGHPSCPDSERASATMRSRIPTPTEASQVSSAPTTVQPFGPYTKLEVLARQGSIGLVARGFNEDFGRWELLKFLRDELRGDVELVRQFKREGRVLAQLSHPNVVQVFTTYEVEGRACLAMEFLQGESLEEAVVRTAGGLSTERAAELFLEAARGLAAAHEVGLLHRDLKPENLFVARPGKGRVGGLKLIDFGLATLDRARRDAIVENPTLLSGTSGGTPLYMAPELWRGHEATPRSDLYALGLTFYFALTKQLPIEAETIEQVRAAVFSPGSFPSVRGRRSDVTRALAAVIDRLVEKDPERRFGDANELVAALVGVAALARPRKVPGAGPYRGLASFTAEERDVFFGRDQEVAEVTERLRTQTGIVLVGPSGSGKSSLAHAGVVPAVVDGALGGGVVFQSATLEPRISPIGELAGALAPVLGGDPAELTARLRREPHLLGQWIRDVLGDGRGIVIVVDQLEELATVAKDSAEVAAFAAALGSLSASLSATVRLVVTLRADLMDRLFVREPLRALLTRGFYPVRPLVGDGLRRALVEPARTAGYDLEDPAIADAIIAEVERTPAGLPLMSFAMSTWWAARDEERRLLPLRAWRAMGGVAGALVRHGDSVLEAMGPEERRAAEQILLKLVTADATRAVVSRGQLTDLALSGAAGGRALERLLKAKLVVEQSGDVQLVHDALIAEWPRFRALLAAAGEDRAFRERVIVAAQQWEAQHQADGALWDGDQATRLLHWFEGTEIPLGQFELGFVDAVRRRAERRRFALRAAILAVVAAVVVIGGIALTSYRRLSAQLDSTQIQAAGAASASAIEQQGLLTDLAELRVEHDPVGALRAALRARELGETSRLDPLAWQIRLAGVPRALPRHEAGATRVVFSPGGGQIATGGEDGLVRLVTATGPRVEQLRAKGPAAVSSLTYSADSERLAWGCRDGTVHTARLDGKGRRALGSCGGVVARLEWQGDTLLAICEHDRSQVLHGFRPGGGHDELLRGDRIALTPTGDRVAAITSTTLRVSSVLLAGDTREVDLGRAASALAFAGDGRSLWIGSQGIARVAIDATGTPSPPAWKASPWVGSVRRLNVSPDGSRAIAFDGGRHAALWTADGRMIGTLLVGSSLAHWIPQRGAVVVAGAQLDLVVLDSRTGARLGHLGGFTGAVTDVDVDQDAEWLAATSRDGGVRAWKLDDATARALPTPGPPCAAASDATGAVCFDSNLQSLVVTPSPVDQRVKRREVALPPSLAIERRQTVELAVGPRTSHAAYVAPGGPLVYLQGDRASAHELVSSRAVLTFARSRPLLAVGGLSAGKPVLLTMDQGHLRSVLTVPEQPTALAFTLDAKSLLVGLKGGTLLVVDATSGAKRRAVALAKSAVVAVAAADDGQIAAADAHGTIYAAAPDMKEGATVHRSVEAVGCLSWTRQGRGLVIGAESGRVSLLDVETGRLIDLMKIAGAVTLCARSPSEDRLIVTSSAGSAWQRLLDLGPLFMARQPADPLDRESASVPNWRGLDPDPEL